MVELTKDLAGVAVYLDTLLASGSPALKHLQNLERLLRRLQDKGLRCRKEKCKFALQQVNICIISSTDFLHTVLNTSF